MDVLLQNETGWAVSCRLCTVWWCIV